MNTSKELGERVGSNTRYMCVVKSTPGGGWGISSGGLGKKMELEEDEYDGEEQEPSVAAMRRFKSGRRADTWAEEALAAVAAASGETTAAEEEKKHECHETEHWARLPVS